MTHNREIFDGSLRIDFAQLFQRCVEAVMLGRARRGLIHLEKVIQDRILRIDRALGLDCEGENVLLVINPLGTFDLTSIGQVARQQTDGNRDRIFTILHDATELI
jgi:hypothetical protein